VAKVTMPQLGESVAEGTIGKWLKQPGDKVAKYEPLVEVITDKVNAEVPSPFEGILKEILVEEGATVPNNAEIAIIETAEDAASGGTTDAQPAKAAAVSPDDKGAPSTVKAEAIAPAATSEPAGPAPAAALPTTTAPAAPPIGDVRTVIIDMPPDFGPELEVIEAPPVEARPAAPSFSWNWLPATAGWTWLAGGILFASLQATRILRWRRRLMRGTSAPDGLEALVRGLAGAMVDRIDPLCGQPARVGRASRPR